MSPLPPRIDGGFAIRPHCIDCGSCWSWDPQHFAPGAGSARVCAQPADPLGQRQAVRALLACPVGAIAGPAALVSQARAQAFPQLLLHHGEAAVHYCGWSSRRSFGASSYLIQRPAGNVMVDSPRFHSALVRRIEALGGLAALVLTHRDDVADQARWADHFGCRRWIHAADADAAPEAEERLQGLDPVAWSDDLQLIPTPGHTAGSIVLLLGGQVLFSGDHLWWSREREVLVASRRYCWWNWPLQLQSLQRLRELDVRWLLPGHGAHHHLEPGAWSRAVDATLAYWSRQPR